LGHGTNADWLGNFEISASSHIVKNGNLDIESAQLDVDPNDERLSKMSVISENVVQSQEDSDAPCAKPNHIEGTLIYKGNSKVLYHPVPHTNLAPSSGIVVIFRDLYSFLQEPLALHNNPSLPHGTEVRFDCTNGGRSWKIVCYSGRWVGLSLGCDENGQPQEMSKADFNSSCPYSGPPSDANVAAFHDFHEIMHSEEPIRYEPGAELLFRCIDIGNLQFLQMQLVFQSVYVN